MTIFYAVLRFSCVRSVEESPTESLRAKESFELVLEPVLEKDGEKAEKGEDDEKDN
jgi:hypothetical protein